MAAWYYFLNLQESLPFPPTQTAVFDMKAARSSEDKQFSLCMSPDEFILESVDPLTGRTVAFHIHD